MLRLERLRNKEINVTVRERGYRINPTLMQAFLIACGLHLSAITLFQVQHYFSKEERILPFTNVETDGIFPAALTYTDEEGRPQRYIFKPSISNPTIPALPTTTLEKEAVYPHESSLLQNPFLSIEENWDYLKIHTVPATSTEPLEIDISGPLADITLLNGQLVTAEASEAILPVGHYRTVYQVQVEGKTGKIFWYEVKELAEEQSLQPIAEKILQRLRFQPIAVSLFLTGEIIINFRK